MGIKEKVMAVIISSALIVLGTGCSSESYEIGPGTPNGNYATQTRNTSLEYSVYINKQITVFTGLLDTRIISINNGKHVKNPTEIQSAKNALDTMKDIRDEVEITYPSIGRESDRLMILTQMETTIKNMEDYIACLEKGGDTSTYADIFSEDFNQLTGLAQMYYQ